MLTYSTRKQGVFDGKIIIRTNETLGMSSRVEISYHARVVRGALEYSPSNLTFFICELVELKRPVPFRSLSPSLSLSFFLFVRRFFFLPFMYYLFLSSFTLWLFSYVFNARLEYAERKKTSFMIRKYFPSASVDASIAPGDRLFCLRNHYEDTLIVNGVYLGTEANHSSLKKSSSSDSGSNLFKNDRIYLSANPPFRPVIIRSIHDSNPIAISSGDLKCLASLRWNSSVSMGQLLEPGLSDISLQYTKVNIRTCLLTFDRRWYLLEFILHSVPRLFCSFIPLYCSMIFSSIIFFLSRMFCLYLLCIFADEVVLAWSQD